MTTPSSKSYSTFAVHPNGLPPPHPQEQAWCFSRAFLSWVGPLMNLGHRKTLDTEDIWELRAPLQAEAVSKQFSGNYNANKSIPKSFFTMFGWRFVLTGVTFFLAMLCNLVGPVALNEVISGLTTKEFSLQHITLWVGFLFLSQVFQALADNYASYDSEVIAIQFVGAMKTLLYRKSLRLSAESRKEKSTGDITNMYTADADSLLAAAFLVHQAWLIPLQIAVVSYMLYSVLDVAAFAGIAVIVLMLYLNNLVSKRMFAIQRKYRSSKDVRMKKVTEVFKSIGIVKFNAWEDKFMERIDEAREVELHDLLRMRILTSVSIFLMWGMPVFISMASFGTFSVVLHHDLTPAIVFTSIALFQLIQGPLRMITQIITMLIQSKVALERVSSFLEMSEIDPENVLTISHPIAAKYVPQNVIIAIEDGEFGWDNETSLLKNVNLQVKVGDFYVVHGTVGCGKS
ncbi:Canalicular multispecific organic anion transporter 2, partial [Globisporangium polare]